MEKNDWFRLGWVHYWIRETPNWDQLHPTGPVHFDVMNSKTKEIERTEIPAPELPDFLESRGWLIRW